MQIKTGVWRRDLAGLQQRRLEAARMFACGATQAEVARAFGVSRQAASMWYRHWHHGGEPALRGAGRTGREPGRVPFKGDRVMVTGRLRQRSWDTPEGEKRSVTELEADEVGASLKWATAKVERASQRGNGERSSGRQRQAERGGDFNDQPPF